MTGQGNQDPSVEDLIREARRLSGGQKPKLKPEPPPETREKTEQENQGTSSMADLIRWANSKEAKEESKRRRAELNASVKETLRRHNQREDVRLANAEHRNEGIIMFFALVGLGAILNAMRSC